MRTVRRIAVSQSFIGFVLETKGGGGGGGGKWGREAVGLLTHTSSVSIANQHMKFCKMSRSDCNVISRYGTSNTAFPTAEAIGFPPNVLKWTAWAKLFAISKKKKEREVRSCKNNFQFRNLFLRMACMQDG